MTDTLLRQSDPDTPPAGPPDKQGQQSGSSGELPPIRAGGAYSRFVSSMRITLPLIAVAVAVIVIAWPQFGEKPKRFSLGISKVTVNDGGGQQIVNVDGAGNHIFLAQPFESRKGKQGGVGFPGIEFFKPGVHIAPKRNDF